MLSDKHLLDILLESNQPFNIDCPWSTKSEFTVKLLILLQRIDKASTISIFSDSKKKE